MRELSGARSTPVEVSSLVHWRGCTNSFQMKQTAFHRLTTADPMVQGNVVESITPGTPLPPEGQAICGSLSTQNLAQKGVSPFRV